jgi:adenosine kinase
MRKAGVNLRYAVDSREPTGICCVCSVGSHTSMVTRLGASASLGLDHLRDPGTRRLMQRAELFYVEGFGLGHAIDVMREVADYATHHNVYVTSSSM